MTPDFTGFDEERFDHLEFLQGYISLLQCSIQDAPRGSFGSLLYRLQDSSCEREYSFYCLLCIHCVGSSVTANNPIIAYCLT